MEHAELMVKLKAVDSRLVRAQKQFDKVRKEKIELLTHCTHPEDKVVERSRYYEGSYYDKASTAHWRECTVCHQTSEVTTETHSYYG